MQQHVWQGRELVGIRLLKKLYGFFLHPAVFDIWFSCILESDSRVCTVDAAIDVKKNDMRNCCNYEYARFVHIYGNHLFSMAYGSDVFTFF